MGSLYIKKKKQSTHSKLYSNSQLNKSNLYKCTNDKEQAPVVQTLDSAIHRINHYPAGKYYGNQLRYLLDSDLSAG